MDIKQQVGHAIRERRKKLGITQEELAMRINTDGISDDDKPKYADQSYISRIELGQSNLTLDTLAVLAKALECDVNELFA